MFRLATEELKELEVEPFSCLELQWRASVSKNGNSTEPWLEHSWMQVYN